MKYKIPVLRFSVIQAVVAVILQIITLIIASLVSAGNLSVIQSNGAYLLFNLFVILVFYFLIAALCAWAFNRISDKKKKLLPVVYVVVAESIVFLAGIFLLGLLNNQFAPDAMKMPVVTLLIYSISISLQTLVVGGITMIIVFKKKEDEAKAQGKKEVKEEKKHHKRKR